jgi:hypothetical protein
MILDIHKNMSLGDYVMCTGIPEAYHTVYGENTYLINKKVHELWEQNPFVADTPNGSTLSFTPNERKDYMIYYPIKIFYDLTGLIVDRELVKPRIYKVRNPEKRTILVNDQSGWPSRRGYRYWNELVTELQELDYQIYYFRYDKYRDCLGKPMPEEVRHPDNKFINPSNTDLIDLFCSVEFYIGYDSGPSHIAGALNVPYVALQSSVPPINTCHDSCIYTAKICSGYCATPQCNKNCLTTAPNINYKIIRAINDYNSSL